MTTSVIHRYAMMGAMAFALVSCSSEAEIAVEPDRNESYTRDFIKDFGVPAAGHTWSEATSTTLTIKSDAGTHVRVCYEEGGTLYLVGDLSVPAGSTDVPFIVPNNVSELKVEAYGETFTAKVGSTLDLSAELSKASSRSYGFAAPMATAASRTNASSRATDDEYPIENAIRFKTEMLKAWDDVFKRDADNLYLNPSEITTGTVSYTNNQYCAMKDWKQTDSWCYLVEYDLDEGLRWVHISWDGMNTTNSELNPGCYKWANGYSVYTENSEIEGSGNHTYDNSPSSDLQFTMQFLGHKGSTPWDDPSYPRNISFDGSLTYIDPHDNYNRWKGFWNVDGYHLNRAYSGAVAYMPKEPVTFKVWRNGQWEERTRPAIFIGFNAPAKYTPHNTLGVTYGDYLRPDFCDVVFMIVPENDGDVVYMENANASISVPPSPYILAAEDLGGSHDWDFNDAVFSVECVTRNINDIMLADIAQKAGDGSTPNVYGQNLFTYEITVTPLAAGGTMPIYVAYHGAVTFEMDKLKQQFSPGETFNDYAVKIASFNQTTANWQEGTWIVGTELHKWLGASGTNQPINVGESVTHTGKSVKFYANADPDKYGTSHVGGANAPLCNFSVIVDKENSLGINTSAAFDPNGDKEEVAMNGLTRFTGTLGEGSYQIGAVSEDKNATAPQMIYVYDFSDRGKRWEWPKENTNIKLAYPKFADWVSNPNTSWKYPGDGNDEHCTKR